MKTTKTAAALEELIARYDQLETKVYQGAFRDYYSDVLAAVQAKATQEIAAKGLNPACAVSNFEHYVPTILWALVPGIFFYQTLSDESVITRLCEWVNVPRTYFDADSALSNMISRGRQQLYDIIRTEPPVSYPMLYSWVEQKPCLKLLFPNLTFLPRKPSIRWIYPVPEIPDVLNILTMYQTMFPPIP